MSKDEKYRQILAAAEKLFASGRFHEIKLDEVARVAGVGKGTIYLYFKDKDDLFFQAATSGLDELCERLEAPPSSSPPFSEQLEAMCEEIARFFEVRLRLIRMVQESVGPGAKRGCDRGVRRQSRLKLTAAVAKVLSNGAAQGVLREDLPSEVLAQMLLGMLRAGAGEPERRTKHPRHVTVLVDLFLNGARPDPRLKRGTVGKHPRKRVEGLKVRMGDVAK